MVANEGFANHHSIVDAGGRHFGFNKNYGFISGRISDEHGRGPRMHSEPINYFCRFFYHFAGSAQYISFSGQFLNNTF